MNIFDLLPSDIACIVVEFIAVDEPIRRHFENAVLVEIEKKEVAYSKVYEEWCSECFRCAVSSNQQKHLCDLCSSFQSEGEQLTTREMSFAEFEAQARNEVRVMADSTPFSDAFTVSAKIALCGREVVKYAYRGMDPLSMSVERKHSKSSLMEELKAVITDIPLWEGYELHQINVAALVLTKSSDIAIARIEEYFADNVGTYLQVAEEAIA